MKQRLGSILLACATIAVVSWSCKTLKEKNPIFCEQEYALCTSAQCIPDPMHPGQTICFCEVLEGSSLGYLPCDKRQVRIDATGMKHVISTFSLEQFSEKKIMTCATGNPWSNCLDQPCVIDPLDPNKAICLCKLIRVGDFQTLGGNCDLSTCQSGYWSAASIDSNALNVKALMQIKGLIQSPQRLCPK